MILNEHPVGYLDEMHGQLTALLDNGPWRAWKHQPGGAYLLRGDRMGEAERVLLAAVARAVLSGDRGDLAAQLEHAHAAWPDAGAGRASSPRDRRSASAASDAEAEAAALALANGLGGFADGGREYAVVLEARRETPLPWANVIANPAFGTVVTASGVGPHLGREQPREPPDALRQRPGQRPDGRGAVHPRRRDGRALVADAGPDAPQPATGRCVIRHSAGLTRFVAGGARHPPRARRLRGRERPGQVLACSR